MNVTKIISVHSFWRLWQNGCHFAKILNIIWRHLNNFLLKCADCHVCVHHTLWNKIWDGATLSGISMAFKFKMAAKYRKKWGVTELNVTFSREVTDELVSKSAHRYISMSWSTLDIDFQRNHLRTTINPRWRPIYLYNKWLEFLCLCVCWGWRPNEWSDRHQTWHDCKGGQEKRPRWVENDVT